MYDIYTEVASFMNWINETILSMGGMQSCGLTMENRPTEGKVDSLYIADFVNIADQVFFGKPPKQIFGKSWEFGPRGGGLTQSQLFSKLTKT